MKITLNHLTKQFTNTVAVQDFNAVIESGHLIALLGPSGCGKSTMLNMISGILPLTSGNIYFDDADVTELSANYRGVGLVFQNYALYPHMSVLENICFPLELQKVKKQERIERAKNMAKLVHVDTMLDRKPSQLSGGQQQRVAIARALVKNPKVLLLDEPLSNLDARLRIEMREEIRRIQQETGVTTIFVTHDQEEAMSISDEIILMKDGVLQQIAKPMREEIRRIQQETGVTTIFVTHDQEEAMSISDEIILMKDGVLQQIAKPQQLYDQPVNCFVADFLGNPPINKTYGKIVENGIELDGGTMVHYATNTTDIGKSVILSMRSESLKINTPTSHFKAKVSDTYVMGKENLAYLDLNGQRVRCYIDAFDNVNKGDLVDVQLLDRGVFVFDAESGKRLA